MQEALIRTCLLSVVAFLPPLNAKDLSLPKNTDTKDESVADLCVDRHNYWRQHVGDIYPEPASMPDVKWSGEAESLARKFVHDLSTKKCGKLVHTPAGRRKLKSGKRCGENIGHKIAAKPIGTWQWVIDAWASERERYGFGCKLKAGKETVLHYTQMIWATSTTLGCAAEACKAKNGKVYTNFLCLYCPSGNVAGSTPYKPKDKSVSTKKCGKLPDLSNENIAAAKAEDDGASDKLACGRTALLALCLSLLVRYYI